MSSDPNNNDCSQEELDNHSDQLNPNNDAYWQSRDYDERPDDWEEISSQDKEEG